MTAFPFSRPCRRRAFTLVELLVVVAIIVVLAGVLLTQLPKAMKSVHETQAMANLKRIAEGITAYRADNNDRFPFSAQNQAAGAPPSGIWTDTVLPYVPQKPHWIPSKHSQIDIFVSPLLGSPYHGNPSDFGANGAVLLRQTASDGTDSKNMSAGSPLAGAMVVRPSKTVLVMTAAKGDIGAWYVQTTSYVVSAAYNGMAPSDHGSGKFLAVFVDGHNEAIAPDLFATNRASYLLPNP